MNFEQWALKYLEDNGLWPDEARDVFDAMKADKANMEMEGVWHRTIDGYPVQMRAVLILGLRRHTLEYIDANKPMHFARPMFTGELDDTSKTPEG
jgi:hypothetical protein